MPRLAALVPRPRLHLIRFHGVLGPTRGSEPRSSRARRSIRKPPQPTTVTHHQSMPARLSWARLLKRVFDIDIVQCSQCGGTLKIIAAIEDPTVILKILTQLGLPARAPPRSPTRSFDRFQMPDPARDPLPPRFHSPSRQPPLAGTRPRSQNAPGSGRVGSMEARHREVACLARRGCNGPKSPPSWTERRH